MAYNTSISAMLLGAVAFQMMIFYAVNNSDPDIRYYSWFIISKTISIFTAVLVFSAFSRLIHRLFLEGRSEMVRACASYAVVLAWLILLNLTIMLIASGRLGKGSTKLDMAAWGTLLAHTSGFASISAGGALQQLSCVRENVWMVLATVPVHCLGIFVVFMVLAGGRRIVNNVRSGTGGEEAVRLWHENVVDAENDVTAICMSFLLVQGIRFAISGVLPNKEGLEEPPKFHPWGSLGLSGCAVAFGTLVVVALMSRTRCHSLPHSMHRALEILQDTSAMGFAWCLFYAAKWKLTGILVEGEDPNAMQWRVTMAITLSAGAFAFIFVLDKIVDLESTGPEVDKAIINIISGLGVLVGFSWEQSFDGAVEHLAGFMPGGSDAELGLTLLVALVVVPAWRKYILRNMKKAHVVVDENIRSKSFMDEFCSPERSTSHLDFQRLTTSTLRPDAEAGYARVDLLKEQRLNSKQECAKSSEA